MNFNNIDLLHNINPSCYCRYDQINIDNVDKELTEDFIVKYDSSAFYINLEIDYKHNDIFSNL